MRSMADDQLLLVRVIRRDIYKTGDDRGINILSHRIGYNELCN